MSNTRQTDGMSGDNSRDTSPAPALRVKTYYPPRDPSTIPKNPKSPKRPPVSPITTGRGKGGKRLKTKPAREELEDELKDDGENVGDIQHGGENGEGSNDEDMIEVLVRTSNGDEADFEPEPVSRKSVPVRKRRNTVGHATKRKAANARKSDDDPSAPKSGADRKRRRTNTTVAKPRLTTLGNAGTQTSLRRDSEEILASKKPASRPKDVSLAVPKVRSKSKKTPEPSTVESTLAIDIVLSIATGPSPEDATIQKTVAVSEADTIDKCESLVVKLNNELTNLSFSDSVKIVAYRVQDLKKDLNARSSNPEGEEVPWIQVTRTSARNFKNWVDDVKALKGTKGTPRVEVLVLDEQAPAHEPADEKGASLDSKSRDEPAQADHPGEGNPTVEQNGRDGQPPPPSALPNGQITAKSGPDSLIGSHNPNGSSSPGGGGDWMGRTPSASTQIPVSPMTLADYDLWKAQEAEHAAFSVRNELLEHENERFRKKIAVLERKLAHHVGLTDSIDIEDQYSNVRLEQENQELKVENARLEKNREED